MKAPALLRAMRPHQWVKNSFVLAALVFSEGGRVLQGMDGAPVEVPGGVNMAAVWNSLLAFCAFCLGSSTIYIVNDIMDVESDRAHPTKCKRPIAAGELTIPVAWSATVICAVAALTLGWFAGSTAAPHWAVASVVAGYMVMNFAYSVKLKHVVLVDAFVIAAGFLLRVEAGGFATGVGVSRWMMLCTFFLALFLALCKRRAETDLLGEGRGEHRAILREYNGPFLDQMTTVLAACAILSYALYTISEDTVDRFGPNLVWTVPFVVFGVGRYLLLVNTQRGGGSPTRVLLGGDTSFLLNILAWMGLVALIMFDVL